MNLGTKLPNQDIASPNHLTAKPFNPAPLAGTIATISGTTARFLMSHI
jgi:hypothetical protein